MDFETKQLRDLPVYKDNKLIQSVKRRKFSLSVLELKALYFILSKVIRPKQDEEVIPAPVYEYTFDIRQFCKVCGINEDSGTNYANVKDALGRLADNSFWLDYGEGEIYFQWIVTPDIKKHSGIVEITIPKKVMPYLYGIMQGGYTRFELYQILALKSVYSMMLYELMKSYAFRKVIVISINDLRKYLSVEDKYTDFRDFRRKLLAPSLKEIEEFTNLTVTYKPIREGRSYVAIEFCIKTKSTEEADEAYRRTIAEIDGVKYIEGQINLFE